MFICVYIYIYPTFPQEANLASSDRRNHVLNAESFEWPYLWCLDGFAPSMGRGTGNPVQGPKSKALRWLASLVDLHLPYLDKKKWRAKHQHEDQHMGVSSNGTPARPDGLEWKVHQLQMMTGGTIDGNPHIRCGKVLLGTIHQWKWGTIHQM